ncbi:Uncharacterised nucleotidyltransferase [Parafrankia irregularis]|uniref:Uncharacterized nucleotidyltransferase n=1 Tax=Parafrankia irregularis TaxID=795642 RepID=A0A0S4QXX3_9ACTN|nr:MULTISPECIES: nucleotidyltransferase family protein [Parafrankia]MBE3206496.1 nucleotidyltransferase family protein [Parafrankia sp. CH37]CUU59950.1 Uncharacterised nucleotidyltransferase [Parafrankia irregularis]
MSDPHWRIATSQVGSDAATRPERSVPAAAEREQAVGAGRERDIAHIVAAAQTLLLDARAAQIITILTDAGVGTILLKGPVTTRRLYPGVPRPRRDTDLLVHPATFATAAEVLVRQGYRPMDPAIHAQTFVRGAGETVDLHWTLPIATATPAEIWAALSAHLIDFDLQGHAVNAYDPAAHACHLAIHAIQAPTKRENAGRDLERAVDTFPLPVWADAHDLARQIGAEPALTTALRLSSPAAASLADALGLPRRIPFAQRLWLAEDAAGLIGATRLLRLAPASQRRALLRRWLRPTRAEMAAAAHRPDIAAATPTGLPPGLRLVLFRIRQVGWLLRTLVRAAESNRTGPRAQRCGSRGYRSQPSAPQPSALWVDASRVSAPDSERQPDDPAFPRRNGRPG